MMTRFKVRRVTELCTRQRCCTAAMRNRSEEYANVEESAVSKGTAPKGYAELDLSGLETQMLTSIQPHDCQAALMSDRPQPGKPERELRR